MKVRLVLDVNAHARYVIAKYFAPAAPREERADRTRTRATRRQVKRFAKAVIQSAVREQAEMLHGRARYTAQGLAAVEDAFGGVEYLTEPREKQRSLAW